MNLAAAHIGNEGAAATRQRLLDRAGKHLFELAALPSMLLDHRGTLIAANGAAQKSLLEPPITFMADAMRRLHALVAGRWTPLAIPIAEFLVGSRTEWELQSPRRGACHMHFQTAEDDPELGLVLATVCDRPLDDEERMRQTFGMSRTEAKVVHLLIRGMSPREAAATLNVKLSTIRTHIQHALEKTQSSRQSELVSKVLAR